MQYVMNENDKASESRNYAKIGSRGHIGATIRNDPLFADYQKFMDAGRYSKALEIAVKLRSRHYISEVENTAKEFYSKHPTISEAKEYSDTKKQLIQKIKKTNDHFLDDLLFEK